jgi:hypothetical protein
MLAQLAHARAGARVDLRHDGCAIGVHAGRIVVSRVANRPRATTALRRPGREPAPRRAPRRAVP